MTFDSPWLLLTLLAIPLAIALYLANERRRARYAVRFSNLDVLASVAGGWAWRRHVPAALLLGALAALCVGMARPHVRVTASTGESTVILVIDASGSMQASDVKPTRLEAAEAAVRTFIQKVPKGVRVGLVVFAGEPQVAAAPTTDHALVLAAVNDVGLYGGIGGTAIGDALAAAVALARGGPGGGPTSFAAYTTAASAKGSATILFLSDGSQTRGNLLPLQGAALAKQAGIRVYTVALGTPNGMLTQDYGGYRRSIPVPPDPDTLRAIAQTTGGRFFPARSAAAVQSAYTSLGSRLGQTTRRDEITSSFIVAAAALLLAGGLLGARWLPRLP